MLDAQNKKLAKERASLFSVFGNARRVLILWALDEKEISVGEIASLIDASLQSTSQHLRIMKDKGVVKSRRDGQTVYYRVANNELVKSCQILQQQNGATREN
ncbi:MAG: metalloregulator ArsR/SmtB family transcription factor [Chloroflexota bacterium]|nr:metalloregulator ArsR/SmtB family transcription factor [Chloroflexota bacterium]